MARRRRFLRHASALCDGRALVGGCCLVEARTGMEVGAMSARHVPDMAKLKKMYIHAKEQRCQYPTSPSLSCHKQILFLVCPHEQDFPFKTCVLHAL